MKTEEIIYSIILFVFLFFSSFFVAGMQYFATISAGEQDAMDENILWLSTEHIGGGSRDVVDLPDMVGSGQSVGGVISETVGGCDTSVQQLQRIVSRCKCEVTYYMYGDNTLDLQHDLDDLMVDLPPPPSADVMDLWAQREEPVDSIKLTHHDLNICTNSLQVSADHLHRTGSNV